MSADKEKQVRFNFGMDLDLRLRLQDFAFLLKKKEAALMTEAISAFLQAVENKKGENFTKMLELLKAARED